jgi:hypothetical protein
MHVAASQTSIHEAPLQTSPKFDLSGEATFICLAKPAVSTERRTFTKAATPLHHGVFSSLPTQSWPRERCH